jgi:hypothetical protein
MSFKAWLQRSWGRLREPNKRHLVATAPLLEFDPSVVARMEQCGEDECEGIFVEQVDEHHGGTISGRASPADLIETTATVA